MRSTLTDFFSRPWVSPKIWALLLCLSTGESPGTLLWLRLSHVVVHFCEPRAPQVLSLLLHLPWIILISFNLSRPSFSFSSLFIKAPPLPNSSLWRKMLLNPSLSTSPLLKRISKSVLKCKLLVSNRGKVKTMEIKGQSIPQVCRKAICV